MRAMVILQHHSLFRIPSIEEQAGGSSASNENKREVAPFSLF